MEAFKKKWVSAGELKDRHKLFNHDLLQLIRNGLMAYSPKFEPIDTQTVIDHASSTFTRIYPDWPGLENILFKKEDAEMLVFEDTEEFSDAEEKIKRVILEAAPEVKKIYNAIKRGAGFTGRVGPEKWQSEAIKEFDNFRKEFSFIKREFLEDINAFSFNNSQSGRDFIGPLLQKILIDNEVSGSKIKSTKSTKFSTSKQYQ